MALSRITELIQAGDFFTDQEWNNFEDIDPIAAQEDAQPLVEKAKGLIQEFCMQEYQHGADFFDLSEIGIAYTEEEDTGLPIQVNVNLVEYRIDRYLHDVRLEPRQYASLEELIDNELYGLDFNDLVDVTQDEIESYYRQHNQVVPITEFRQSNGRWVEGWEVPSLTRDLERASSGIFIADRGPLYKAVLAFERANHIQQPVIAEDGNYEDKVFLYAAYDEYVGMSHRAELESYAARFLYLAPDEAVEPYLAQIYYAKQNGLSEADIDRLIDITNDPGKPYNTDQMSDARIAMEDRLDRWNQEVAPEAQFGSFEEILDDISELPWQDERHNPDHYEDDYGLLSRLKADCEYFLGYGGRAEKNLWKGNIYDHIKKMRELYDSLPEKPEWLTKEDIDNYAKSMARRYLVVAYHHFENGFDAKLDYQTLEQAEKVAMGYVDGTMEEDGFQYPDCKQMKRRTML